MGEITDTELICYVWSWSYGHPKPEPSFDVTAVLDINCKNELDTAIEYIEALSKKNGINVTM